MHDLTESSPVYSGILFLRVLLDKRPHLILEVIECSEKLMSGGEKRWFQIRHDIAQAKALFCAAEDCTPQTSGQPGICLTVYVIFLTQFFPHLPSFLIQILTGQQ